MKLESTLSEIDNIIMKIEDNIHNYDSNELLQNLGGVDLLDEAISTRNRYSRISDYIHARSIVKYINDHKVDNIISLSLGATTKKGHRYDMVTENGVYEFKMAKWNGKDTGRIKSCFKDFCDLILSKFNDKYCNKKLKVLVLYDEFSAKEFKKLYSAERDIKKLISASQYEDLVRYLGGLKEEADIKSSVFMNKYGSDITIEYIYK